VYRALKEQGDSAGTRQGLRAPDAARDGRRHADRL